MRWKGVTGSGRERRALPIPDETNANRVLRTGCGALAADETLAVGHQAAALDVVADRDAHRADLFADAAEVAALRIDHWKEPRDRRPRRAEQSHEADVAAGPAPLLEQPEEDGAEDVVEP